MKRVAPVLALSLLLLSACASVPEGERMTWGYAEPSDSEGPRLAYGLNNSDILAVVFFCDPSTGLVSFDVPIGEGVDVGEVKLKSDGVVRLYEPVASPEADPFEMLHFKTDRQDPVLETMARSGRLSIDVYGQFVSHDAKTASERGALTGFAKACGLG